MECYQLFVHRATAWPLIIMLIICCAVSCRLSMRFFSTHFICIQLEFWTSKNTKRKHLRANESRSTSRYERIRTAYYHKTYFTYFVMCPDFSDEEFLNKLSIDYIVVPTSTSHISAIFVHWTLLHCIPYFVLEYHSTQSQFGFGYQIIKILCLCFPPMFGLNSYSYIMDVAMLRMG